MKKFCGKKPAETGDFIRQMWDIPREGVRPESGATDSGAGGPDEARPELAELIAFSIGPKVAATFAPATSGLDGLGKETGFIDQQHQVARAAQGGWRKIIVRIAKYFRSPSRSAGRRIAGLPVIAGATRTVGEKASELL